MNNRPIAFPELVAYAQGRLDGERAEAVEAFVARSATAARQLALVRRIIETLRRDDTCPPTARALRGAAAAFPSRNGGAADGAGRRYFAPLVFDSRVVSPHGAPRGLLSYTLAYQGDPARIEIELTATTTRMTDPWRLRGVVASRRDSMPRAISLRTSDGRRAVARIGPEQGGRFRIDAAPGVYTLFIEFDEGVLIAPHLDVGGSAGRSAARMLRPLEWRACAGDAAERPSPTVPPARP